jgi:drug/metabolite transporter (DMT)-like permease
MDPEWGGNMNSKKSSRDSSAATGPDWLTVIAFLLLAVFAGGNPVAVRFSNSGLPPFWGASLRFSVAALIFWAIVLVRGLALPKGRALVGTVIYGLLSIGGAYAGLYWGLVRAPAGLAGAVLALVPLMTLLFASAHKVETFRWRGLIGVVVATAGILVGVVGGFGGAVPVTSVLALVAGVACLAEAGVVFKLFPQSHPMVTNALALTTGTPLLMVLSRLTGEEWALPTTPNTWAAFAYLTLIGSVGVFYLYLHVLSRWTASATSYAFLLMPVATVILAALLAGEVITTSFVIGAALVIAGVWVGAFRRERERAPEQAEVTCPDISKAMC